MKIEKQTILTLDQKEVTTLIKLLNGLTHAYEKEIGLNTDQSIILSNFYHELMDRETDNDIPY